MQALYISLLRAVDDADVALVRTGSWSEFAEGLRVPLPATIAKSDLALWSPATFTDGHRASESVEAVYALGLDIDETPVPGEAAIRAALAGVRAVVHSTSSATATAPRWRGVIALSRPVTADEYRRLWAVVVSGLPFRVGQAAKDPSRAWYVPRRGVDGFFVALDVDGEPLDVDALLADADAPPTTTAPTATAPAATPVRADRRALAAELLGGAWPETGRHVAQLALAGALRRDGWSEASALEILCDVCRVAGNEDRPKRSRTIAATYASTAPVTGWTRLGEHVDPVVVAAARGMLAPDADAKAEVMRMLDAKPAANDTAPCVDDPDELGMHFGAWDAPAPDVEWLVQGLIPAGTVGLFVARGSSCKTWAALDIARAVVTGSPWLGRYPVIQGGALAIDFESGENELRTRIRLLQGGVALPLPELGMMSYPSDRIDDPEFWKRITRVAKRRGIRLIVVDSLAAGAAGTDENDARAAMPLQLAALCTEASGASVLVVAHARKSEGGDDRDMIRGSSAFYAACDWAYTFDARAETDTYRRVEMRCIKPCAGFRPLPVGLELSKAGRLSWYEDDVASAGRNATSEKDVRAAILLALANGPIQSKRKLCSMVQHGPKVVEPELDILLKEGDVVLIEGKGEGYQLDDDDRRRARVRAQVGIGWVGSAARLAKASYVTTRFVETMIRERFMVSSAEGRIMWTEYPSC